METIIVLFGATGDLMRKKVLPGLYYLYKKNQLPKNIKLIGFSRRDYSNQDFRDHVFEQIKKKEDIKQDEIENFLSKFTFISSYFDEEEGYKKLADEISGDINSETKLLFYYSIAQQFFEAVTKNLEITLDGINVDLKKENIRVLLEKPIGTNLEESKEVDSTVKKYFSEEQIYRVDHYLFKDATHNLFNLRRNNPIFESIWNNNFIEKIEINTNEDFGVEDRGSFYDPLGAIKDVAQNHLLELMSVITMDLPKDESVQQLHNVRAQALANLPKVDSKYIKENTYRSQYENYKQIEGVEENSQTETYLKIRLKLDSPRWRNVPVILQTGKKLEKYEHEVHIKFRKNLNQIFNDNLVQNVLKVYMTGDKGMTININLKKDEEISLNTRDEGQQYVGEYMQMILSAIKGDRKWFISQEEVENAWRFIDPIVDGWKKDVVKLNSYPQNSSEPLKESSYLDSNFYNVIKKEIGVIGLGKMGGGIARQLKDKGWKVIAQNRSNDKVDEFINEGGEGAYTVNELVSKLGNDPKLIWVMLPSGDPTNSTLAELAELLHEGDIVIDAGNSNFKQTKDNYEMFKSKNIKFIDAGVSGGPSGARNGACVMIGGDKEVFEFIENVFEDISLPGAYKYFGQPAAGHYVKMVHNGIEYGIMQAIAEGFGLMKESEFNLDLRDVAEVYAKGSVISSRLIDWLYDAFIKYSVDLNYISGEVKHSGEGQWTVEAAKEKDFAVNVIEEALKFRINSEGNPSYTGKIVSALRNQFGGHEVSKMEERKSNKIKS